MKVTLKKFTAVSLYEASKTMLDKLSIKYNTQSKEPIDFERLYTHATSQQLPKALVSVLSKVKESYYIGAIDEATLKGEDSLFDIENIYDDRYQTMLVFAVEVDSGESITRSEYATLTRGFNQIAASIPVILYIRRGNSLSIATCERTEYRQNWRDGEKLGKVSILKDINCENPHRGHLDILTALKCNKSFASFEQLYQHWMRVFSTELLTKKFYTELSEWYAWVIGSGKVKFPNNINTTDDDTKYNHEAVIRLITRLIFVWFLKQKNLIPDIFFNKDEIQSYFIEGFDPNNTSKSLYNPEESKYYRLILQNLFFAVLNRPIRDDESGEGINRRFVSDKRYHGKSTDFNINNLLRYYGEFKIGGAEKFLEESNSKTPFLNGGLFECLDHKDKSDPEYGMYYDGFSENSKVCKQLSFPDYFFFSGEREVDLSFWYADKKKNLVKIRGIIDILHRYNFTIEENTPLDQEVSLDPELLGKVFENLLAAYNPETDTTARKQTGSFYTPRPIVQYMVDESLITYLIKSCPQIPEDHIRSLFSYSKDDLSISHAEKRSLMSALYNCKIIDPACGSGAFPMGVLQQMVHVLRKIDSTNELWKEYILDCSLNLDNNGFTLEAAETIAEKRQDIEAVFDPSINDPDYARKLYLIENCIYGVDIQPIATQISKLRFFISLIAAQKKTTDPKRNFGIRPLPNLDSNIVAANSLIPLNGDNLWSIQPFNKEIRERLEKLHHELFLARRTKIKREIRNTIRDVRKDYAASLTSAGFVSDEVATQLSMWDMFNQNDYARFFDSNWMFGIEDGFDVVIGNPPYVIVSASDKLKSVYDKIYEVAEGGKRNLYHLFFERGICMLKIGGVMSFITPDAFISGNDTASLRNYLIRNTKINKIILYSEKDKVFENVTQAVAVSVLQKGIQACNFEIIYRQEKKEVKISDIKEDVKCRFRWTNDIINKIKETKTRVNDFFRGYKGDVNLGTKKHFFSFINTKDALPLVRGNQISAYTYYGSKEWCLKQALSCDRTGYERIVFQEISNATLERRVKATLLKNVILGDTTNFLIPLRDNVSMLASLGVVNSKIINYYFKFYSQTNHVPIGEFEQIPFPVLDRFTQVRLETLVNEIFKIKSTDIKGDISQIEDKIDMIVYHLYNLSYEEICLIDPAITISREEYDIECQK